MPTYLVSPPGHTAWREDPKEFAAALEERWPDARITERPQDSTMASSFEFEENGEPVSGSLHRDGRALSLSADLPVAAMIAVWWRDRVPERVDLILYDEGFDADAPVGAGMDATTLMSAYLAAAETGDHLPLGEEVDWEPVERPTGAALSGSYVLLRPVDPRDAEALYGVSHLPDGDPAIWTYLPDGPYEDAEHLRRMLTWAASADDFVYYTLAPLPDELPLGIASYLRITPEFGVIEIGHIWFGPALQRTAAATEAIYLLARHAFDDLGYRRLEWKCNALNAASRRAAERFGFTFEGTFRKDRVVKGRSRDTAWYAITDEEWPAIRDGFEAWLAAENFDGDRRQRRSLWELIAEARG